MPQLRLEPAASSESLFEMPPDTIDTVALVMPPSISCPLEVMNVDESTAVVTEERNIQKTDSFKSSQDSSPSPQKILVPSADTPSAIPVEPATPKSARKRGTARRLSVSSSKSETHEEEASSNRRITRSCQKQIPEVPEEPEATVTTKRSRRTSLSSQDGLKDAVRNRRSSVSSVTSEAAEDLNLSETKLRKRRNSTSSQVSVVESVKDVMVQDKLDKISEEGSVKISSTVISEGTSHGTSSHSKAASKTPRRRKTSEVSNSGIDDEEKPSEKHPVSESASVMQTYETSRRLTRHQRAVLAKSIEMNLAARHASFSRPSQVVEDENRAISSDDDDKMSVCSVRSSQRLRAKRQQQEPHDSPSSTASTVINPALTPTVQRRRRQSVSSDSKCHVICTPIISG